MAYKALYRTYRPTSFEKVVGQQHIVKTLQNAVLKHKIAHAYLFCGPRGTGKTTVAKLMAKAVNCPVANNAPCNVCDSCLSIQAGTHPDIIEIDAASNN
ncbi:MAG TPA: AAA family ATPase, partial [Anaerolineaceae bacterium]|nr:AAA family ATPase [Anaerolineaceae bacterium]